MSLKKGIVGLALLGSLAATSAFAQNNNTGEIVIQGVVPGIWEITVLDINEGYDFDLSDTAVTSARVGTVHVYTNGPAATTTLGHLRIESANSGRMINTSAIPAIAADNQIYDITLTSNSLSADGMSNSGLPTNHDLIVPATVDFTASAASTSEEDTFDVVITIDSDRPEASGVYSDTVTFTIMDDG